jgi:hypothetical protein
VRHRAPVRVGDRDNVDGEVARLRLEMSTLGG